MLVPALEPVAQSQDGMATPQPGAGVVDDLGDAWTHPFAVAVADADPAGLLHLAEDAGVQSRADVAPQLGALRAEFAGGGIVVVAAEDVQHREDAALLTADPRALVGRAQAGLSAGFGGRLHLAIIACWLDPVLTIINFTGDVVMTVRRWDDAVAQSVASAPVIGTPGWGARSGGQTDRYQRSPIRENGIGGSSRPVRYYAA